MKDVEERKSEPIAIIGAVELVAFVNKACKVKYVEEREESKWSELVFVTNGCQDVEERKSKPIAIIGAVQMIWAQRWCSLPMDGSRVKDVEERKSKPIAIIGAVQMIWAGGILVLVLVKTDDDLDSHLINK